VKQYLSGAPAYRQAVADLSRHLDRYWTDEGLAIQGNLRPIPAITNYTLTLEDYNRGQQLKATLRIERSRFRCLSTKVPGLRQLAEDALQHIKELVEECDLEVFDCHFLKQRSFGTAGGGSFGPHRDNHDNPAESQMRYSVIVKLTEDPSDATELSQMRVLEPDGLPPLCYPPCAGSSVTFRSQVSMHSLHSTQTVVHIIALCSVLRICTSR
jgi:hypothetical protein